MEYINRIKTNSRRFSMPLISQDPVLTADDEAFLQRVTSEPSGRELSRPAVSPEEEFARELGEEERKASERVETSVPVRTAKITRRESLAGIRRPWNWIRTRSVYVKRPATQDRSPPVTDTATSNEAQRETADITEILDRLNLAAVNNRAFSISDETQELLRKFKLVLTDLLNGVPTAYRDLETLLKNGNQQLQQTYSRLPSFLTKLIEKLPERWMQSLAPEVLAAATEKVGRSTGIHPEHWDKASSAAGKMGIRIPSLQELVGKPAAIVGMLRSIVAFLRARFPAVMGMNVLWSLALFILLLVLWYCHKRGREVRLGTETNRLVVSGEETTTTNEPSDKNQNQNGNEKEKENGTHEGTRTRTNEIQQRQQQQQPPPTETKKDPNLNMIDNIHASAPMPQRMKSLLSRWSRSTRKPIAKIEPYPGT